MAALPHAARLDRLYRNFVSILFALVLSLLALAALAAKVLAQAPDKPAELPPVEVTTSPSAKAKSSSKKSSAQSSAMTAPAPSAPMAAEASDPATALGSYNPALDLPDMELPPGTTLTTAGPVYGYQALSAMSSTKTATPIEQIPQAIQVIPKAVLDDQRPTSIGEALQNVSNTQGPHPSAIGNAEMSPFKIRGFSADLWIDGMPVLFGNTHRDAYSNIERVEVLKGPSAILYGGGAGAPVSGAVNLISKLPTDVAGGEFGIAVGSHDYLRTFFDINQPITSNGTVLFRLTGEYSGADSYIDVLESDRYAIDPTLTITNKTDTTLTIQGSFAKSKQQAYPGLPAVGTVAGDFRIDPSLYTGDPNIPRTDVERQGVTVSLDHRFDPVWSFNVKTRYSKTDAVQPSQGPTTAAPDVGPTTWTLLNVLMGQQQEEFTINPNLQARFALGETKNTALIGADYSHVTDKGYMFVDTLGLMGYLGCLGGAPPFPACVPPSPFPAIDLKNPSFQVPYKDPAPGTGEFFPAFDADNTYVTKGAYVQLQSTIYDRVHLLAGARLANIDIEYNERAIFDPMTGLPTPTTFRTDETKVLPRAGAVVDLTRDLSVYASYSEGMRWVGYSQAVLEPKPEESEQREVGIKFNFGNQLSGTAAYFEIDRSNVPATGPLGVASLTNQSSRGYEFDLLWQPNRNWSVLANYGYTDIEFSDDFFDATSFSVVPAGTTPPGVPEHSGRLWVNYEFDGALKGFSAGAGIYAASGSYVDTANIYKTGSYYTIDAKIGYENETFAASLNVKNLTDEDYFVPYIWFDGQVAPGADRQFFGTLVYKY